MSHIKLHVLLFLCFVSCDCNNITTISPEFGNRILNGKRADDYQFPYQVSLQKHRTHVCGGSIISDVKVLTAGHCVSMSGNPLSNENFRILAGTNYLNNKDPTNYYSVKQISVHPKYNRHTVQYDYAIVFIDGHFNFKFKFTKKIALATQEPRLGAACYVSGWGDVTTSSVITTPNVLQFATITIDPPCICKAKFGTFFKSPQMICAGEHNIANAGVGDSGGPLACNNFLTGVVSFGGKHYDPKYPDVYSSVYYVLKWINTTDSSGPKIVSGLDSVIIFSVPIVLQVILLNKV